MTTSPRSDPKTSPTPTSGAAGSPARTSPSQAKELGSTRASGPPSGGLGSSSFAWFDRASSSWRTWQRSLLGGWETYSEPLPKSGSMRSGTLCPLPTSAHLIFGGGSSSSPTWQTPVADDSVDRAKGKVNSRGEPKLSAQVMLPTPCATDHSGNKSPSPGAKFRPSLHTMARKNLWPTPRASDHKNGRGKTGNRTPEASHRAGWTLSEKVRLWPTPRVSMANGPSAKEIAAGDPKKRLETAVLVRLCPTSGDGLATSGVRIPTPDANCWKGGDRRGQLTDPSKGITPNGGQLNPTFVCWLMGFPQGWTEV